MSPEQLVSAALAARAFWVPLPDGRRVRLRRPSEYDVRNLIRRDTGGAVTTIVADLPDVKRAAIEWEGFTEADIIPSGASDPVPFSQDVFAVWIEDNRSALAVLAQALIDAVIAHESAQVDTAKN